MSENMLNGLLADFQKRHAGVRVAATAVDLTDCFWSPHAEAYVAPRGFGDLATHRVVAYAAFGARLVQKYQRDADGQVVRDGDGIPVIHAFTLDNRVMACLCVFDLRNTSYHEIRDAMSGTHRIQGFRRWHMRTIEDTLRAHHPHFRGDDDTAFLFAGPVGAVHDRVALNALWLEQILTHGPQAPEAMGDQEAALMGRVFPAAVLAGEEAVLRERAYMHGRPTWQPQSADFLARKAAAWRAWQRSEAEDAPRIALATG